MKKFESLLKLKRLSSFRKQNHKSYHKNVISLWYMTSCLEKFHEIMELAMNITTNSYWTIDRLNIGLFNEDLFYLNIEQILVIRVSTESSITLNYCCLKQPNMFFHLEKKQQHLKRSNKYRMKNKQFQQHLHMRYMFTLS